MMMASIASTRSGMVRLSRRRLLEGFAGLAATCLAPGVRASAPASPLEGELFAFKAPGRNDLIFALAMAPLRTGQTKRDPVTVRLQAGASSWTVKPSAFRDAEASHDGVRVFSGRIRPAAGDDTLAVHLVAVAVPAGRMAAGGLDVWADIIDANGGRARVGNPVVSRLLAGDARLAQLHSELDPTTGRRLLATAITRQSAAGRFDLDAQARARRLAGLMVPDTLRFDPNRPEGFTFAAMNGRRPDDAIEPIVQTLLSGAPCPGGGKGRYRTSTQFPYFAIA